MPRPDIIIVLTGLILAAAGSLMAQEKGTLNPRPLPALANPANPKTPAKELFARKSAPVPLAARAIGSYVRGCLAGAVALPINGKTWQVMRLSRDRNWGHPDLVRFLERFADKVPQFGWPGLLVGDISQPRGGPMLTGHTSHQIGLDADIWLTPMPNHELSREEREAMSATNVVAADGKDVDSSVWTPAHVAVIRAAAEDPQVERIFCQRRNQEGAMPRRRLKSCVALQSAAMVESHVSFPRPHPLPSRQCGLSRPA